MSIQNPGAYWRIARPGSNYGRGVWEKRSEVGSCGARCRRTEPRAYPIAAARRSKNAEAIFVFPSDLRKPEDAEKMIQEKHFVQVDILVNNAGSITAGPVENQSNEEFKNVMETNFFSGVYCALSVLPQMLESLCIP